MPIEAKPTSSKLPLICQKCRAVLGDGRAAEALQGDENEEVRILGGEAVELGLKFHKALVVSNLQRIEVKKVPGQSFDFDRDARAVSEAIMMYQLDQAPLDQTFLDNLNLAKEAYAQAAENLRDTRRKRINPPDEGTSPDFSFGDEFQWGIRHADRASELLGELITALTERQSTLDALTGDKGGKGGGRGRGRGKGRND